MIIADALIDPQLIGFLTNKFSQLSMRCRAPPAGAWIETATSWLDWSSIWSRPPAGAWIETGYRHAR